MRNKDKVSVVVVVVAADICVFICVDVCTQETELRALNDVKYSHLNEDLHVEITAYAHAAEAYSRIGRALFEIKRFLVPDYYDDIRQQQLRELGVLKDVPPYGR